MSLDEEEEAEDGGGECTLPSAAVGQNLLCRAARRDTRPSALWTRWKINQICSQMRTRLTYPRDEKCTREEARRAREQAEQREQGGMGLGDLGP